MKTIILATIMFSFATCQPQAGAVNAEKTEINTTNTKSSLEHSSTKISDNQKKEDQSDEISISKNGMNKQETIYLKEGENKFLKAYEMNVTFKRIVEDSRCPKDVQCVWQGTAVAEVEFMGLYTRPVTLQFSTLSDSGKGLSQRQDFNGYTISLVSVAPEITTNKASADLKGNYRIALRFEKDATPETTTQRAPTTK